MVDDYKSTLKKAKKSADAIRKKRLTKERDILKKKRDKELLGKAKELYSKDKKKRKFDFGWPKDMDPGMDPNYRFNLLPEEEKKKRRKLRIPVSKGNLLNKGGSVKLAKKYFKGGLV